jgi:hypothetical protein
MQQDADEKRGGKKIVGLVKDVSARYDPTRVFIIARMLITP